MADDKGQRRWSQPTTSCRTTRSWRSRRPSAGRPRSSSTRAPHAPIDPMRHSHGARHGRGGDGPVPGREARHRAGDRRRLLLRLPAAAAAHARRPRGASRRACAESIAADHPFVRKELPFDEARALVEREGQPFKVEILDDLAAKAAGSRRAAARRRRSTSTARSSTCAAGPHVESTGKIGPFKLLAVVRRLLARRPEAADRSSASTARSGRRRRSSTSTCGGARRRRSATTASWACSSTCSASTTSRPGSAFWHPKGWRSVPDARECDARAPGPARLPGDLHAAARPPEAVGAVRATGTCTATTCSWSSPRARRSASSR